MFCEEIQKWKICIQYDSLDSFGGSGTSFCLFPSLLFCFLQSEMGDRGTKDNSINKMERGQCYFSERNIMLFTDPEK